MNIFKAIFSIIVTVVNGIITLFKNIATIFEMITCPYTLYQNLGTCMYFYFLDIAFWIVWIFVYWILFIFIYIPIAIVASMFYFLNMIPSVNIGPDDICPTKLGLFHLVENFNEAIVGGRFLYRNGDDKKKCYCNPALIYGFDPLLSKDTYSTSDDAVMSIEIDSLVVALAIVTLVFGGFYYAKHSHNYPSPASASPAPFATTVISG